MHRAFSSKKILFLILFVLIGFLAMQVPFSQLVGVKNLKFSLFDFYGPIVGAFLGSLPGIVTVFFMQMCNWAFHGFSTDTGTLLRFIPVLFAVLYFAKHSKWTLAVPVIAMIGFWIHPEGRQAWYFALYWTIPLFMYFFREKFLFARALGATFTQHSVGGVLWAWSFNMKASVWIGLIPIVWKERVLMAVGMTLAYIAFNYLLGLLERKGHMSLPFITINPKYTVK